MDRRGIVLNEVKRGDRTYTFARPIGYPLAETYDVLMEMLASIDNEYKAIIEIAKTEHIKVKAEHEKYAKDIDVILEEQKKMNSK